MYRRLALLVSVVVLAGATAPGSWQATGRPHVGGGGHATYGSCEAGITCGFDFGTGVTSQPDGSNVRGTVRVVMTVGEDPEGTTELTFLVRATCLEVVGNKAGLAGEILESNPAGFEGDFAQVWVQDNAGTVLPDGFQFTFGPTQPPACPPTVFELGEVDRGNIVVGGETT